MIGASRIVAEVSEVEFDHNCVLLPLHCDSLNLPFCSHVSTSSTSSPPVIVSTFLAVPASDTVCAGRSLVFLAHIALEAPVIIQAFWSPATLPFLGMNNTSLVLIKVR